MLAAAGGVHLRAWVQNALNDVASNICEAPPSAAVRKMDTTSPTLEEIM